MSGRREPSERARFAASLGVVTFVGLIVRIVAVARASRTLPFSDGLFFHVQAHFLAHGAGFVDAGRLAYTFVARPSAQHPPLFPLLLAAVTKLGGDSVLAHQLACAVMSTAAIPLIGLTAREVGGSRAGLAAAGIAAVYPNLWASDVGIMSESLYVTAIALVLWTSCRLWKRPTIQRAVVVGVAIALASLVREEAILLLPLALVPQCAMQRRLATRRRFELVGAAVLAATIVVTPWVIRNLTTFDRPVFLADNIDSVIAGANCPTTYYGPQIGSWDGNCNGANLPTGDESVQGAALRARGLHYARTHLARVPVVVAARVGRSLDVFEPLQGLGDSRSRWMRTFGTLAFWLMMPFAGYGAVIARRRSMTLAPFVGQAVVVVVSAAVGYGLWRLRLGLDVAAIVLAGVAVASISRPPRPSREPATEPARVPVLS